MIFMMGQVFTLLSPFSFLGHDPVDSSIIDAHNGWLCERSSSKSAEEMSRCLQDPPGCPEMSRCLQDPPGCPEMSSCLQDPPGCPEMSRCLQDPRGCPERSRCLQDPPGCPERSRCLQDPPGYRALSAGHWKQLADRLGHWCRHLARPTLILSENEATLTMDTTDPVLRSFVFYPS